MPSRALPCPARAAVALLALLVALLGVLLPAPARAADQPADPLAMTIEDIDGATINGSGPITVSGTITNNDDTAWTDVNVYPFLGNTPITSERALATQAALPLDAYVGQRILVQGHYATIDKIAPGQTIDWSLSLPRRYLEARTAGPGVYWFGVHALGADANGRDSDADGRARTFLPLLPSGRAAMRRLRADPERVAVVLPIRHRVIYQPDGRIANVANWTRDLSDTGRLGQLLSFGSASTDISWLVDPAVLDAVRRLAAGNPGRNLGPTDGQGGQGDQGGSPSGSASPGSPSAADAAGDDASPGDTSSGDAQHESPDEQATRERTAAAQSAAQSWLDRFRGSVVGHEVLALPYADPDLPAMAAADPGLYDQARARGNAVLTDLGIHATPAVAPPTGYLDAKALKLLDDHPLTLVSDRMIRGAAPAVADVSGNSLVVTSADAASGGPAPDPTSAIGLRQRIVAQAALRARSHRPVVVVLPDTPSGSGLAFVHTLESTSWLRLGQVADAVRDQAPTPVETSRLVYPESEATAQIPGTVFSSVDDLIRAGRTLERVLSRNDEVATEVLQEALTSTSYAARAGHGEAADRSADRINGYFSDIRLEVPPRVALSSTSGHFSVTIDNALDEPISVKIRPVTDDGLHVSVPDILEVPPHSRSTQLLNARATRNGAHSVRIELTDSVGHRVGDGADIPLRTGQVSIIIWWFIGVGCALLFGAIAIRFVRRIRAAQAESADSRAVPPASTPVVGS